MIYEDSIAIRIKHVGLRTRKTEVYASSSEHAESGSRKFLSVSEEIIRDRVQALRQIQLVI